ncbi:MAG: hypothetical protein K2O45_08970 [Oscillospiraceae bacterium]|nr:hypothetical protein [Oscillospiraceae bacterium]
MIVTFCGHSKLYNQTCEISKWLDIILPSLIEGGAATFYLGGYGNFDSLAAAAVRRQKATYPNIEAVLVLAYLNRDADISRYDSTAYPPLENVPPRYAIVRRNEWMVRESDVVISGVTHGWGGAAKTLDYARRRQKIIFQFPIQTNKK